MKLSLWGGALALSLALTACVESTRSNIFVPDLTGADADERRPRPVATAPARPDSPRRVGAGTAPRSDARREGDRPASVIRAPAAPDAAARLQLRQPVRIGADGSVTMSFERIGVPDFARAVFGEILGLDFTVAPGLTGAVSLSVGHPVTRAEVFPIAERTLAAAGVLVRRDGDLVVVEADPRGQTPGGPATVVIVRRLQHVDRAQVEQALQPFAAPDARIGVGPQPDSLILSGSESGVAALNDLVAALDIDPLSQRAFGLFRLQSAAATEVADELSQIIGTGQPSGPQVIAIERINALLVVAPNRRAIDEAQFWIRNLDQSEAHDEQIHVYQAQNRRAAELAEVLQQALSGRAQSFSGGAGREADTGFTPAVAPGLTPVTVGDQDSQPEPEPALRAQSRLPRQSTGDFGDTAVFADEGTNSIMIIATAERYRGIEAALRRLDVQPVQVLIEATIIEVTLNDKLEYGVRWFFESGDASARLSEFGEGEVASVFPGFNFVLDTRNVQSVVSALDAVSDLQIVSSPSLMVLNNETARLEVGDEVSIVSRSARSVDTAADAPLVQEFERRQTGVILEITPRVNTSGVVLLDVTQEVSTIGDLQTSGSPDIAQRRFQSSVLLNDRETVALGGLIRDEERAGKSGIPILSDIPVIGALFGATTKQADRTELLVVLRPIVIRSHAEARAAYEELRAKLVGLQKLGQYLP